ncbi:hypothetical protein CTI12_AA272960 [Artemisia annua]|uniref:Uncharacterized protein n=1 Tax=Artemisia annua TaxID=35608 RepID=A0A2U1NEI3_ARTAN|nr:hypothetical protein CTI12_AA272960 [Artemisia annua]
MERLTRSFSTTSVDINKAWRRKVYDGRVDGSPDGRKDMKTATLGESHHSRFWKIKKFFKPDGSSKEEDSESAKKTKQKSHRSSKIAGSREEFESRLMSEIYKNMSASHELSSVYK